MKELLFIIKQRGITISEIKNEFNIERATAQRDMKELKKIGFITFIGSPKTGKYMITPKFNSIIDEQQNEHNPHS